MFGGLELAAIFIAAVAVVGATTKKRFHEIAATAAAVRVDRENGIIRGVKIIGLTSRNGRRYLPEALRRAVPLYEGAKVYIDHPRIAEAGEDRPFANWAGVLRGVQFVGDGLAGDLHLRQESPHAAGIFEAAERFPNSFGLSHEAEGDYRIEGGVEVVHRIDAVMGVAVVNDPATTRGIFESLRQLLETDEREQFIAGGRTVSGPLQRQIDKLADLAKRFAASAAKAVETAHWKGDAAHLGDVANLLDEILKELETWLRDPSHGDDTTWADDVLERANNIAADLHAIFERPAQDNAPVLAADSLGGFAELIADVAAGGEVLDDRAARNEPTPEEIEQRMLKRGTRIDMTPVIAAAIAAANVAASDNLAPAGNSKQNAGGQQSNGGSGGEYADPAYRAKFESAMRGESRWR
jgi:hypothetical protein